MMRDECMKLRPKLPW